MSAGGIGQSLGRIQTGVLSESFPAPGKPFKQIAGLVNPEKPGKAKSAPAAPTIADRAVGDAIQEELERLRRRRGFGTTILTSPLGDTSNPILQKKTLLGG